jgi:hypothetical protein
VPRGLEDVRLLALSPTYIRAGTLAGWEWLRQNVEHATIANTGNNVPYPLFGAQLSNSVVYVNIDRHADWRFHDYAKIRSRLPDVPPGALARPSGQLMPLLGRVPDASRPRYERWEGSSDAWLQNLRKAGATHVFVTTLSAYEIGDQTHNDGGYPIEDDWARADPRTFVLVYENNSARIYRLDPTRP